MAFRSSILSWIPPLNMFHSTLHLLIPSPSSWISGSNLSPPWVRALNRELLSANPEDNGRQPSHQFLFGIIWRLSAFSFGPLAPRSGILPWVSWRGWCTCLWTLSTSASPPTSVTSISIPTAPTSAHWFPLGLSCGRDFPQKVWGGSFHFRASSPHSYCLLLQVRRWCIMPLEWFFSWP